MAANVWPKGGVPGILHHFTEKLVALEFTSGQRAKPHSLIFVGGLSDGIGTTAYVAQLVRDLEPTSWSIIQPTLSSSYHGWGTANLDQDVDEIAQVVSYVREHKGSGKIVLMGHSTGSQDVLHYLHKQNPLSVSHAPRPAVDGAILQAPVSDRQAIHSIMKTGFCGKTGEEVSGVYHELVALAKAAVDRGEGADTILPIPLSAQIYPGTALSSYRFLSLASPESPHAPGEDDLFSSDLPDEQLAKTFGQIKQQSLLKHKLMVLMSGSDASVPAWIDKDALLQRWRAATNGTTESLWWDEGSGAIPGANHALDEDDQDEPRKDLSSRVQKFLSAIATL